MKLGVFYDMPYRSDGRTISADIPVIRFITSLPPRVEEVVLFGRLNPVPGTATYVLPDEHVRLVPLPFYRSIFDIPALLAALPGSCRRFAGELDRVDAVWLFGPNPLAIVLALIAFAKRKQVFLGVRQDYPEYIAARLPSPRWRWALPVANTMEHVFRLIVAPRADDRRGRADRCELPRRPGARALRRLLADPAGRPDAARQGARALVGGRDRARLGRPPRPGEEPAAHAGHRRRAPRARPALATRDRGRRAAPRRDRAARSRTRGLGDAISLLGYVPNGEELWSVYRSSNAFLHVSLTEGAPMVFFEAESAGLPIVATDVGGVSAALGGGERGLLVPPRDAPSAIAALERLAADPALREQLDPHRSRARHGRTRLEAHLDKVAAFFETALASRQAGKRP